MKTPKEYFFSILDRIEYLKVQIILTEQEQFELRQLEVKKWDAYSDWKD